MIKRRDAPRCVVGRMVSHRGRIETGHAETVKCESTGVRIVSSKKERLVVGISGASGAIYGIRLLQVLCGLEDIETHVLISNSAKQTILLETDHTVEYVESLATRLYRFDDVAAAISSGSFKTRGMVVIPCSVKTLSSIAYSFAENLLIRAADVTLKEHRRLVL